jgi:hypothetical protein
MGVKCEAQCSCCSVSCETDTMNMDEGKEDSRHMSRRPPADDMQRDVPLDGTADLKMNIRRRTYYT